MNVPVWLWVATVGALLVLLALDFVLVDRKPHEFTTTEAAKWVSFHIGCAVLFGVGLWWFAGSSPAVEFFTGYITEYSLSVDNLFIFMVIMSRFAVPVVHQHRVLLIGIVIALAMRSLFILAGAGLINSFAWIFFVFGAFLLWTSVSIVRDKRDEKDHNGAHVNAEENFVVRQIRRCAPVTEEFHGSRSMVTTEGKRHLTPMFVVIVAIGTTDLLFAVDSIPAIFGITQEALLVFAANAFALMGLRQLYFLLGNVVEKLVYLSYGLAIILSFIGVKLVLHALSEYGWAPSWLDIDNWMSLAVIVIVLVVTTLLSLHHARRQRHMSRTG